MTNESTAWRARSPDRERSPDGTLWIDNARDIGIIAIRNDGCSDGHSIRNRILDCVIACEGINPEAFDELLAVCELLKEGFRKHSGVPIEWGTIIEDRTYRRLVAAIDNAEAKP